MATRMNPAAGRYFNSPAFAAAASNLAGMFAPPDAGEILGYAQAQGQRAENERLEKLWEMAGGDFDKGGMVADLWNPNQSMQAVRIADQTARRGQDIGSADNRYNTDVGARTDLGQTYITSAMAPLDQDQLRPGLDPVAASILGQSGFEMPPELPGPVMGLPAPRTETEMVGMILGDLSPEDQRARALQGVGLEKVVGPDNRPMFELGPNAAGREAYVAQGTPAAADLVNVYVPGKGVQFGTFDPTTKQLVLGDGTPAPAGSYVIDKAGADASTALGTSTTNAVERQLVEVNNVLTTLDALSGLISDNPASQGLVGSVRGTFQNLRQTGNELGTYFGGEVANIARQIDEGLADPSVAGGFDPTLPAIEVMSNVLAFQYAKTLNPDRLSNEMLLQAKRALGLDRLTSNQADSLARLSQVRDTLTTQQQMLARMRNEGIGADGTPAQPGGAPTQPSAPPQITSDADYEALPSGTTFIDPEGNTRVKP